MGRRLALLIATYDYQDPGLRRLTAPAHDAEALAAVLHDPAIAGFEVTTLINEPHYRVGEAIGDFYRERRRDDLTLLYFTGHGLKDDDGRLYLAMANSRRDSLLFTAVSAEQIDQAMGSCVSRQKVLILDCCYSGAFPAGRLAKADTAVQTLERFRGRGRTVLTASDATQYAFEGDRPRGDATQSVFTRYLVAGLRDGSADLDGDGDITLDELYGYVHDRVVAEMPQQRPKKQDDVQGRTIIARNVNWSLPGYLRHAIASPIAADRLAALEGLDHLYRIGNDLVRDRVREELHGLADDDSRQVSAAAAALLQTIQHQPAATPTEPPVPPAPAPDTEPVSEPPAPPSNAAPSPAVVDDPPLPRLMASHPVPAGGEGQVRYVWPDRLRLASVLLAIVAVWLLVAGVPTLRQFYQTTGGFGESLPWYLLGMAAVTAAAAVFTLLARTRSLIGPGMLVGAAAASGWGLVLFASGWWQQVSHPWWQGVAGHVTLVLAAGLAGLALYRDGVVRFRLRPPPDRSGWVLVVGGGLAAGVAVLATATILFQLTQLAALYEGRSGGDEVAAWARSYLVATAVAVTVPVFAATATPRRLGLAVLAGWAGGGVGAAASTYVWNRGSYAPGTTPSTTPSVILGCALLLVAIVAAVLMVRPPTPVDPAGPGVPGHAPPATPAGRRRTRRVLRLVALATVPLLATAGAVAVDRIAQPADPASLRAIATSPDGRHLYVAHDLSYLSVIDIAKRAIVGYPIPVGSFAEDVAVSPDGTRVYVTSHDGVSVIDTATHERVGSPIPVGESPEGLAISPDGTRLYVANSESGSVSVIDTARNRTVVGDPIRVGNFPTGVAISPDGTRLYVANNHSSSVTVIDTTTNSAVGDPISLDDYPTELAISPDGGRVYVVYGNSHGVSVIDTATNAAVDEPIAVEFPETALVGPDGRLYVASGFEYGLSVIDQGETTLIHSPIPVGEAVDMAASPDGDRIYVAHSLGGRVWVIDTATNQAVGTPIAVRR